MSRPVPSPRTKVYHQDETEDVKPICSPTPESPTKPPKGGLIFSTPPPVAPKKWIVKKSSGGFDSGNGDLETVKAVQGPSAVKLVHAVRVLPLLPNLPKQQCDNKNETLDDSSLMDWWKGATPWKSLCKLLQPKRGKETDIIKVKAEHLYKAVRVYILLMSEHRNFLKEHIAELLLIADNLDKVSKGTKIAGITGGAASIAGGVAAAAGVILSPITLGTSLALTVVGVGVAAAGGVTGASAAIAHKVNSTQDKKKIENIFQEYEQVILKLQHCLKFINEGMEQLREHDLSVLSEARNDSMRVSKMIELAATGGASARAIEASSKACGMIHGFAMGTDMHFTQGRGGPRLKKGHESSFAKKIRKLANDLNDGLDELMKIKDLFSLHCSVNGF